MSYAYIDYYTILYDGCATFCDTFNLTPVAVGPAFTKFIQFNIFAYLPYYARYFSFTVCNISVSHMLLKPQNFFFATA